MNSFDEKFDNNVKLSEALARALIKGDYEVTSEKYDDATVRVIHIDVEIKCKESLILVSSRVFSSLGEEKEKINHHLFGKKYLGFRLSYSHPFKFCKKFPSDDRKEFLDNWSIYRITQAIKEHIYDSDLKHSLEVAFTDPRHKDDIKREKNMAYFSAKKNAIKNWVVNLFPKAKGYSDY
jgi:hypothetical protein